MKKVAADIEALLDRYYPLLSGEDKEAAFTIKTNPTAWSKKEELGHLIDSAQNNIQRFIRVQYEPTHIMYHPDHWVSMNAYQQTTVKDLVQLWYLLNRQLITILKAMPESSYQARMSFDKDPEVKNTTLFIAEDYVKHMQHHLEKIVSR